MASPVDETASTAPRLWTGWRDRRDGSVIEIVRVMGWNRRIAVLPPGGHGSLLVDVGERGRSGATIRSLPQHEFEEHFEMVYDPYTGWDAGDLTNILTDLDGALARLPQAEKDEYRRCQQSVIDARASAWRNEGQRMIG